MAGESASLSLAVIAVTVSPVKLCPSLRMVECLCDLWNKTLVQLFIAFYASKICLYFIKNKLLCFLSLLRLLNILLIFLKFLENHAVFYMENELLCCGMCVSPN